MNVDLRLKQASLPKLLPIRLVQTRALKRYNMKNTKDTIYIKNINARRKTGNNKSYNNKNRPIDYSKISLHRNPPSKKNQSTN